MNNTVEMMNKIISLVNQKKLNSSLRCLAELDHITLIEMEEGKWYGNTPEGLIFWAYKHEVETLKNILNSITIL